MVQYQKFMFDNFVISDDADKSAVELPEPEQVLEETTIAEPVEEMAVSEEAETVVAETVAEQENLSPAADEPEEEPESEEEQEPEEEPEPGYSQDELDAAVKTAEEKGYAKGLAAASAENEERRQELLEKLETGVKELLAGVDAARREDEQSALKFALSLVRKILPKLEESVAKAEIEGFLSENFARFRTEKSLSFGFHPEMAAEVAPLLSKLAAKNDFEGKIAIHKDAMLGLSDCRVEWQNGGVERRSEQILNDVEELINQ